MYAAYDHRWLPCYVRNLRNMTFKFTKTNFKEITHPWPIPLVPLVIQDSNLRLRK